MPRKINLATPKARLALAYKPKAYFLSIAPGISLGYRRNNGPGAFLVRVADGKGEAPQQGIGTADDIEPANGRDVLNYAQAVEVALRRARNGAASGPKTVAQALEDYERDLRVRGKNPGNASVVRFHLPPALASRVVGLLTFDELRRFRDSLSEKGMKSATVVRVLKSLKAALNPVAPEQTLVFRKALGGLSEQCKRVNKVQTDETVKRLIAEAYALDPSYGLYLDVIASTGTRRSQALRLLVNDLQADRSDPRLMIPSSDKGKGRNKEERTPVPITRGLALKLKAAASGRDPDASLLLRSDGTLFNPDTKELEKLFDQIAERVGISETEYCLRHSSITRMLIKWVPIRLVAVLHNTSVYQIEQTYSKFIGHCGDDIVRGALLDTSPALAAVA